MVYSLGKGDKCMEYDKLDALMVYQNQCAFFGITPKEKYARDDFPVEELYKVCERDFKKQTKAMKRKYVESVKVD